jgi:hypothetical protein
MTAEAAAAALAAEQAAAALAAEQAAAALAAEQAAALAAQQAATNTVAANAANAATNQSVLNAIGATPGAPASAAQLGGYGGANAIGAGGTGGGISTLGAGAGTGAGVGAGTGANLGYEALAKEVSGIEQVFKNAQLNNVSMSQAEFLNNSLASASTDPATTGEIIKGAVTTPVTVTPPPAPVTVVPAPAAAAPAAATVQPAAPTLYGSATQVPNYGAQSTLPNIVSPAAAPVNPMYQLQGPANSLGVDAATNTGIRSGLTSAQTQLPNQGLNFSSPLSPLSTPPEPGGLQGLYNDFKNMSLPNKLMTGLGGLTAYEMLNKPKPKEEEEYKSTFDSSKYTGYTPERPTPYKPQYASGGNVESYAFGGLSGSPMRGGPKTALQPMRIGPMGPTVVPRLNQKTAAAEPPTQFAVPVASAPVARPVPYKPQYASGGLADLGGYSDGGRMLKGPGDGMSDNIPATIAGRQPARLANEEFVIPADVVSHLGNGSSEAGAKQLYKMMDRIRKARTGTKKQGKQINPEKYLA